MAELNNENIANTDTKKVKKTVGREILEWIVSIAVALIVALILRNHVVLFARVEGPSMIPTLQDDQRLVVWQLGYKPEHGDVVILDAPNAEGKKWVKRVIALEGDEIEINNTTGEVFLNGEKLDEPYINDDPQTPLGRQVFVVPEGHVFVMGDNRGHSTDSRFVGSIKIEDIDGKVVLRIWPLNAFGTVK